MLRMILLLSALFICANAHAGTTVKFHTYFSMLMLAFAAQKTVITRLVF